MKKSLKYIKNSAIIIIVIIFSCAICYSIKTGLLFSKKQSVFEKDAKAIGTYSGQELEIAAFQGGYSKDYWDAVTDEFVKAYPGVEVKKIINPLVGELIRPRIASGNTPDFLCISDNDNSGVISSLIKDRALLELTDVFSSKALDKEAALKDLILQGLLDTSKLQPYRDGKFYLAPFSISPLGLVYNKHLFEKRGWSVPETWEDFFKLGDLGRNEGRALFTYPGIYPGYLEAVIWPSIASQVGMDGLNRIFNYEEGSFDNPDVKKVLDVLSKISTEGYLLKGTTAMNHTQAQQQFLLGKAMFIPNGTWIEGEMLNAPREPGFEFGMIPIPGFDNGDSHYVQITLEQFSIPLKSNNHELAIEFLKFLYTDKSVRLFGEKSNGLYALKGAREIVKGAVSETNYNSYKIMDNSILLLPNWTMLPNGSKINIAKEIYEKNVPQVMNHQITSEQWIDNIEKVFAQARDEIGKLK